MTETWINYPGETIRPALTELVDKANAHVMTDSANKMKFGRHGWTHSAVDHHRKEYTRHEDGLTIHEYGRVLLRHRETWSKRDFHHVSKQYLDMYMREFDFRYNRKMNDFDRTEKAIKATGGKTVNA